jgi:SAM-dependent methyltransferase
VRTILDVGCGSGQTSKRLIEMGYKVACVSPSPVLSQRVRELLGNSDRVFECRYEQLETDDRFDLVLFSESFQYIKVEEALGKTFELLNPTGWLLICDVFRKDIQGSSATGGGQRLAKFYKNIENFPFEQVEDLDITERTAPNLDLLDETLRNVVRPIVDSGINFLNGRYPLMSRVLNRLYRRRINSVRSKYFDGRRTSEDFRNFKSYRLFLYRNTCAVDAELQSPDNLLPARRLNVAPTPV